MTDESFLEPLPYIFFIEPLDFSKNVVELMDYCSDVTTVTVDKRIDPEKGEIKFNFSLLYNRITVGRALFYFFAKSGNQSLHRVLTGFFTEIPDVVEKIVGYIFLIDLERYQKRYSGNDFWMLDYHRLIRRELRSFYDVDATYGVKYIIAIRNPQKLEWNITNIRKTLSLESDVPIIEYQNTRKSILSLLLAILPDTDVYAEHIRILKAEITAL